MQAEITMQALITEASEGKHPSKLKTLNLNECKSSTIVGLTEDFSRLQRLLLSGVGLESLAGLPKLLSLIEINLSQDKLKNGLELLAEQCPNLIYVNLAKNPDIESLETISPLGNLKYLKDLHLHKSGIAMKLGAQYTVEIFNALPGLKTLDGEEKDGSPSDEEVDSEDGSYGSEDEVPKAEFVSDDDPMD